MKRVLFKRMGGYTVKIQRKLFKTKDSKQKDLNLAFNDIEIVSAVAVVVVVVVAVYCSCCCCCFCCRLTFKLQL